MTYIALLGRQPMLGLAELERVFGAAAVSLFSDTTALVETNTFDIQALGGCVKAGRIVLTNPKVTWTELSTKIIHHYSNTWKSLDRKQTLGISVYDWSVSPRDVQKLGLTLKANLKKSNTSLRLIPNGESALGSAVSHHNKLGLSDNKTELLIVRGHDQTIVVAESTGAQNITALAARDQGRPKRDAFVGMLPPKLALMMVNLAAARPQSRILDPFCGTGVILQEALLRGFDAYGTDLSDKMVDYSQANLAWLQQKYPFISAGTTVHHGDAIETIWQSPIDAVVTETYLGQPFSAPPAPDKLQKVRQICNEIISKFLLNVARQLKKGTPLCVAVPAWRDDNGDITYLPLIQSFEKLGYTQVSLEHVSSNQLIYFRENQIVARQLLILTRT